MLPANTKPKRKGRVISMLTFNEGLEIVESAFGFVVSMNSVPVHDGEGVFYWDSYDDAFMHLMYVSQVVC